MKLIKTPVKGMADMLPSDMRLRNLVLARIRKNYSSRGFMEIETPAMEHIENLTSKQGGDNEKLIFKVLKRGAELRRAIDAGNEEFADSGLRYDLTVPLVRYYSNNKEKLPVPFKALQIGNVWRADNPQKGRFRQFTQCDIDILGDETDLAEIELISATAGTLTDLFEGTDITGFTVHINDRRILAAAAVKAGFREEDLESVLISLDKYDKIGKDGVRAELIENGFSAEAADNYLGLYDGGDVSCEEFCDKIGEELLPVSVKDWLLEIMECAAAETGDNVTLKFDPSLVRGMGYYTGTIFEVTVDGYGFSIAGGGRYDRMVGKFTGQETCACGFSIGFERIITILKDKLQDTVKLPEGSTAILIDKKVNAEKKLAALHQAAELREQGLTVIVEPMRKNMKQQIALLEDEGYTEFLKIYND
ncbi:MAG: histidine--tRNA ligase [Lachnospiraceae bacterium]|nr:histidine--tRNA ligase [Lachnospiraceae bacterium]